jgi:general stress protein 26
MGSAAERNRDDEVSTRKKLDELHDLIDGIEIAMFTTRCDDGSLVSRPMQTQERRVGTDLWFMTSTDTHKVEELQANPEVNLAYFNDRTKEWVSVSGTARCSQDRTLIRELYRKSWKAWLGDEGGERDGGPDDPRILLIDVEPHAVTYMKSNTSRVTALFKVVRAIASGAPPDVGDIRHLRAPELTEGRATSDG